jgi:hypothetical protein
MARMVKSGFSFKGFLAVLCLLVLFVTGIAGFVYAQTSSSSKVMGNAASLRISMISQDPDPVGPGSFVDVRFKVENVGSKAADDVHLQLVPKYPFSLDPGDDGVKDIGSLQGNQLDDEAVIVKYRLRVDDAALQETSEIELRFSVGSSEWQKLDPFYLEVKTPDAFLSVESIDIEPSPLRPGEEGTITVSVRNIADSLLRDIRLDLDLSGSSFTPVGSVATAYIGRLDKDESTSFAFKIFADPSAESKAHKIPLIVSYSDDSLTKYSKNYTAGVIVFDAPSYVLNIEDRTLREPKKKGKFTLSISNTGSSDLKYLTLEIVPSDDYVVLSKNKEYLGNLESDDFETSEFEIYPAADKLSLPVDLVIAYKDKFNNAYSDKKQVVLGLYSPEDMKKYELAAKKSNMWMVVVLLGVLLVAWIFYRRWEKKRRISKSKSSEE